MIFPDVRRHPFYARNPDYAFQALRKRINSVQPAENEELLVELPRCVCADITLFVVPAAVAVEVQVTAGSANAILSEKARAL